MTRKGLKCPQFVEVTSGRIQLQCAMSAGGQWRVLRHYLSLSNLQAEVDKLLQRVKASDPQQWDNLIHGIEKAISVRLSQNTKDLDMNEPTLNAATSDETNTIPDTLTKAPAIKEESAMEASNSVKELSVGSDPKDLTMEGLLLGLRRKKDLHFGNITHSAWKSNKPVINKSSIHSRTAYVISALVGAQSGECRAKRAADFIHHINQYPEARDYAIKEGAVRALLRVRQTAREHDPAADEVRGIVNEALTLMGYTGPTRGPGPNILALDGGGIRGLIAIEILRHLERLTGRSVNQLFDYIIGVSTGAIIAAVVGSGVGTLDTASQMYRTLSKEMFGNTSVLGGTSRLVWTHSYYDTAHWERLLRDNLGDLALSECNRRDNPKMALVSCVVNPGSRLSPFLFRTYSVGFRRRGAVRGSCAPRLWQAVRASAAAPTYFDEFKLAGDVHQDGGIMVNNPCGIGVHEARLLYGPEALMRATVVSVGTGQPLAAPHHGAPSAGTSWRDKFNKILDSATDTEGVHLLLNDLLPAGSYYRFNPPLMEPCNMDEIDPAKLQNMITDTNGYIRRNQHKFEQAAARLVRSRSLVQRASDALRHRALLLGLTTHH